MSEPTYVTSGAVDRIESRLNGEISEINKHIKQNSEAIVRLETLYGSLSELPSAIGNLEKAVISLRHSLETIDNRIETMHDSIQEQRESIEALKQENNEQNKSIEAVDNKSKIDWSEFITKNFWSIIAKAVVVVGGIIAVYELIFKR